MRFGGARYKQKGFTPLIIILGILVMLGIAGGAFYYVSHKLVYLGNDVQLTPVITVETPKPSPTSSVIPTATVSGETTNPAIGGANWKTYTDPNRQYSFEFPSNWTQEADSRGEIARITFNEGNLQYAFNINQGGRGLFYGYTMTTQTMQFAGMKFVKKAFSLNGIPVLIAFAPGEAGFTLFNNITMDIPSQDSSKYLTLFDQILSTFKFLP